MCLIVVDPDRDVADLARDALAGQEPDIHAAGDAAEGAALVRARAAEVLLLDLGANLGEAVPLIRRFHAIDPKLLIVLMASSATSGAMIEAMRHGAYDFLMKPAGAEKLRGVLLGALRLARERVSVVAPPEPARQPEEEEADIVGVSEPMQRVYKLIGQVAASNATVLITGESGTGKELAARAIARHSGRADKPFIAVNCAAIPEALLESELFGHEKGAFTSAVSRRMGKFELADGGTLFLDEIGDMSPTTQTKILRVLQRGEFERIGGRDTIRVDVRIIAATNARLEEMIEEGRFREDLFFRLNVVRIELPPLRERTEDIAPLAEHFLRRANRERAGREARISAAAMERLLAEPWPGNVRELENAIRHAVLTAKGDTILPSDIRTSEEPGESRRGRIDAAPADRGEAGDIDRQLGAVFEQLLHERGRDPSLSAFDVVERALIVLALNRTRGNKLRAAALLGITRATLRKRIAKYAIELDTKAKQGG